MEDHFIALVLGRMLLFRVQNSGSCPIVLAEKERGGKQEEGEAVGSD
jgi:hypothetical protein